MVPQNKVAKFRAKQHATLLRVGYPLLQTHQNSFVRTESVVSENSQYKTSRVLALLQLSVKSGTTNSGRNMFSDPFGIEYPASKKHGIRPIVFYMLFVHNSVNESK